MFCTGFFTVPKGLRYHFLEEELLSELELKNQCKDSQTIIPEIDYRKHAPPQLPELARTRAKDLAMKFSWFFVFWFMEECWRNQINWYFFTAVEYKYDNSSRVNRTTEEGSWKITGTDREIKASGSNVVIGKKRILTFYKRGGPKRGGQKTGWVIHEYFLIQEHGKQIGDFVVCCLKYNSDNSDHDKDAPFSNQGMASNVENQAEENSLSQAETGDITTNVENQLAEENLASKELFKDVPIPNGNDYGAETGVDMISVEEEYLTYEALENAVQAPIVNPTESAGLQSHSSFDSDLFEFIKEVLGDPVVPVDRDSLFPPPAPPQLGLHQSSMYTNLHKDECHKRAFPFEQDDPSLLKKKNISTDDDDNLLRKSTSNFENQAANVIPEGYSQQGVNVESNSYSFLPEYYDYTQPSINGEPRDFSNGYSQPEAHLGSNSNLILPEGYDYAPPSINGGLGDFSDDNDYIALDDLSPCKGINSSLAEFPNTVFDEGYPALAFGAPLRYS